jgi:TonB family protein
VFSYEPGVTEFMTVELKHGSVRVNAVGSRNKKRALSAPVVGLTVLEDHRIGEDREVVVDAALLAQIEAHKAEHGSDRFGVMLTVCMDATGAVTSVDVDRPSGVTEFDAAAVAKARTWSFKPIEHHGKAIVACGSTIMAHPP